MTVIVVEHDMTFIRQIAQRAPSPSRRIFAGGSLSRSSVIARRGNLFGKRTKADTILWSPPLGGIRATPFCGLRHTVSRGEDRRVIAATGPQNHAILLID